MNGPAGSTIAQCSQDRRSTRGVLSRYPPQGQCSDDLESSSPSTKPGQLHPCPPLVGEALDHAARVGAADAPALLLARFAQEIRLALHVRVLEREAKEQFLERG